MPILGYGAVTRILSGLLAVTFVLTACGRVKTEKLTETSEKKYSVYNENR